MPLDRQELKIQALRERLSSDKAKYEDEIADLRVALTILDAESQEQIQSLQAQVDELTNRVIQAEGSVVDVIDGEVVDVQEEE